MKWYRKTQTLHMPVSFVGVVIDILAIIFLITAFVAIDRNSHSVSDTLYAFFPYFASTFLLVEWLASKTSH